MSGNRWWIIVLLMGYAALGHFNRVGISVAGDEMFIPKLGIAETRMGSVYTACLIVYTIGMLPGGWLIDRIGSGRALTLIGLTMEIFVVVTSVLGWVTGPRCCRPQRATAAGNVRRLRPPKLRILPRSRLLAVSPQRAATIAVGTGNRHVASSD
ncbi:MAG: hypothetical protein O3C40_09540 [Planctomycetota bacterium]|nr:hypothetical protein [Planctomycetota bacterium]